MPMLDLTPMANKLDFTPVHAVMRRYVDADLLAGVSCAVLIGREVVDRACVGWADREQGVALRSDHLFRAFSNTKLVTTCAALLLAEEGRFLLDDSIEPFIPQLGRRRVLRPGAASLDDTEPARGPITIRQLLCHSAGLSYGIFDPGTLIHAAYNERNVLDPTASLAEMMDTLAELPLVFHPGTGWEYSVATDVVARLVEVVSGRRFDQFLSERVFGPLDMVDTGFTVPVDQQHRLTAYYAGADPLDPMAPGLQRMHAAPHAGAYLRPFPRLSGGGGLVTSLPDMITLLQSLLPDGPTLLKPETIAAMMSNQLPEGVRINFSRWGRLAGMGFGLGGALTLAPSPFDPAAVAGEFQWGGIAGTHWWISPRANLAGLLMTQRRMAFWHPFYFDVKRAICEAVAGS
jgi:CubicO group peptidase (beta-lactamase class C family)